MKPTQSLPVVVNDLATPTVFGLAGAGVSPLAAAGFFLLKPNE
jgi:hypothetical protein